MVWYLGVIVKLHNDLFLINILTGEVINGNPIKFDKSHYQCWCTELRNPFSPVIIDTTHKVSFLK